MNKQYGGVMTKVLHITKSSDVIDIKAGYTYHIYSHDAGLGLAKLSDERADEILFLNVGHFDSNLLVDILQKYNFPKQIIQIELDSAADKRCWLKPDGDTTNKAFCMEVKKTLGKFGYKHVFDTYEGRIVNSNDPKKWQTTNADLNK